MHDQAKVTPSGTTEPGPTAQPQDALQPAPLKPQDRNRVNHTQADQALLGRPVGAADNPDQQGARRSGPADPLYEGHRRAGDEALCSGQLRMAHRLADTCAHQLMFVHAVGWHYWTGTHWAEDDQGYAARCVIEVLKVALSESVGDKQLRVDVNKVESAAGVKGVLKLAESFEQFIASPSDLDADPFLLNCANGTLDLRSGELRPHDPRDRITKVCRGAYRSGARSAEWDAFLATVLPDAGQRGYLQRVIGQSLMGEVREHLFPILTGTGANGKGTAYGAIGHAMGSYGIVVDPEVLMVKRYGGSTTELLDLRGARLAFASETGQGRMLDETLMKRLAGGDGLRARRMYKDTVQWDPSHQLIYITNHLPSVKGDDPATWRRIRVIAFNVTIPEAERDAELPGRLKNAADEILTWAIEGHFQYRADGMQTPVSVKVATEEYQLQNDAVRRFVAEECTTTPGSAALTSELHAAWQRWAQADGAEPLSDKAFGKELDRLGFCSTRTKRGAQRPLAPSERTSACS
jgi:putative DNA primase/helicase